MNHKQIIVNNLVCFLLNISIATCRYLSTHTSTKYTHAHTHAKSKSINRVLCFLPIIIFWFSKIINYTTWYFTFVQHNSFNQFLFVDQILSFKKIPILNMYANIYITCILFLSLYYINIEINTIINLCPHLIIC